jgi:hypothetical protein
MANIMGLLGGLGQGISAGVQDLERMEEAKNRKEEAQFRKELQQRERERLAEEKRLGEAVKGIKRSREGFTPEQAAANTQAGFTNLPTRDDEGRLVYGATETAIPRSEAELLKEEAALYAASPDMRNRTLGRQLQGEARTLETQDKIRSIQSNYSDTLKAINADPNKWVQDNMAKFNSDGTYDLTFNNGLGFVHLANWGSSGLISDFRMIKQSDGKILIAGNKNNGFGYDIAVTRVLQDGSVDFNFGTFGEYIVPDSESFGDYSIALALQSDGEIILGGKRTIGLNADEILLTRIHK